MSKKPFKPFLSFAIIQYQHQHYITFRTQSRTLGRLFFHLFFIVTFVAAFNIDVDMGLNIKRMQNSIHDIKKYKDHICVVIVNGMRTINYCLRF